MHSEELQLLTYSHLEKDSCVRQGGSQGSSDAASKSQHGKARSWPYKHLSLCQRPLQPALSWKPTKTALLGVPYSRHVTTLLQEMLFTMVPAHLNIAQKCQHAFTQQSCHSRSHAPKPLVFHPHGKRSRKGVSSLMQRRRRGLLCSHSQHTRLHFMLVCFYAVPRPPVP